MHPQTLRMYEARGLITPKRSPKNTRLYSQRGRRAAAPDPADDRRGGPQPGRASRPCSSSSASSSAPRAELAQDARARRPSSSAGWPRRSSACARSLRAEIVPYGAYETRARAAAGRVERQRLDPDRAAPPQARVTSSERVVGAGLAAGRLAIGAGLWVAPDAAARALGFERPRLRRPGAGPDRGQPRPRPRRLAALLARRPRSASPRDAWRRRRRCRRRAHLRARARRRSRRADRGRPRAAGRRRGDRRRRLARRPPRSLAVSPCRRAAPARGRAVPHDLSR